MFRKYIYIVKYHNGFSWINVKAFSTLKKADAFKEKNFCYCDTVAIEKLSINKG